MTVQPTICVLGYTHPLSGAFGAHPVLGGPLDLNDGQIFTLTSPQGVALSPPIRTLLSAGNIRTTGEAGLRAIYRHNREVQLRVILGPSSSYASFIASVRSLLAWLSAPPRERVVLKYQPMTASAPVYLDVVAAAHTLPTDEEQWLRLQLEPIEILLVVRPGLRGERVVLQNLVANPGFEAPMGGGTAQTPPAAFFDTFTTANAYTSIAGSAPSVAANVMTVPAGAIVQFGSPVCGAISLWQVRFQWATGLIAVFNLHYTDANNRLAAQIDSNLYIAHVIAGTSHNLGITPVALTNGTWYWIKITQFPSPPGDPPVVVATLYNDASGSVGTQVATTGAQATFDAVTALIGPPNFEPVGASLKIGGAFNNVQLLQLFGPGGWLQQSTGTGVCSFAWDGTRGELGMSGSATPGTQTYGGGPVTSFGSARIDLPPAGTVTAGYTNYAGGTPTGTNAMPVAAAGNTLGVACYAKSQGLHASNAGVALVVNEYDASGSFLRASTAASTLGGTTNAGWTRLAGSVTTGASCAYVGIVCQVTDTAVAGESANAVVWFDTVQVWNQTTTGQTSMPYCELRFPNSPAQLVVSGLQGDLPTPAALSLGSYVPSLPTGAALTLALGRAGRTNPNAALVGASHGWYASSGFTPQSGATLDATSYNGFYPSASVTSAGWNPRAFSLHPADALGIYALFVRFLTQQSAPNLTNVQAREVVAQLIDAWYGLTSGTDQLGAQSGPWTAPIAASNTWQAVNVGQVSIPPLAAAALADLSQNYVIPRPQWVDNTLGGSICSANAQALVPIDGSLLLALLNNPANAPFSVTNQWLWTYFDALLAAGGPAGVASSTVAWTYSLETSSLPNAAHSGGGPGSQTSGAINLTSAADPYLTLDPALGTASSPGTNQLVGLITDTGGTVLPLHAEIVYTPLYLWPR